MKSLQIALALLILATSCSEESEDNSFNAIIGTWSNSERVENSNYNQPLQYVFNPDHTFTVSRIITDQSTNELVGYRSRAFGMYTIEDNVLHMVHSEVYDHDDTQGLFSTLEDLKLSSEQYEMVITISFQKKQKELVFNYSPCGELANCLSTQTFQRN